MNQNKNLKNNSGWILCPSKSFPGKFYYFNVLNGEAAWSLNDDESKKFRRDDTIHKITDKSHCYPEPDTPPIESPDTSSSNFYQTFKKPDSNYRRFQYPQPQTPTFGQVSIPKYLPTYEPCIPNIVWAPIPYQNSLYIPAEIRTPTLDQIPQTFEFEKGLFVHTSNMPMCKRIVNYEKPVITFDKANKILNKGIFDKHPNFKSSTPIKSIPKPIEECRSRNSKYQLQTIDIPNSKTCQRFGNPNSKPFQFQPSLNNPEPFRFPKIEISNSNSLQFQKTEISNSKPFQFHKNDISNSKPFPFHKNAISSSKPFQFHKNDISNLEPFQFPNNDISNTKPIQFQKNEMSNTKQSQFKQTEISNSKPFHFHSLSNTKPFQFQAPSIHNSKPLLREPVFNYSFESNDSVNSSSKQEFDKIFILNPYHKMARPEADCDTAKTDCDTPKTNCDTIKTKTTYDTEKADYDTVKTDYDTAVNDKKVQGHLDLESNDLRFLLVAKRKQIGRNEVDGTAENKKIKSQTEIKRDLTKKKVSFNLSNLLNSDDDFTETFDPKTGDYSELDGEDVEELASPEFSTPLEGVPYKSHVWYLVADSDVLLEDYEFIIDLVQSDEKCRLLVPHVVRSDIDTLSMGDYRGRPHISVARRLSRQFAMPPKFVVMQPASSEDDVTNILTIHSILQCCVEATEDNCRVVLVTNDPHLRNKARAVNIEAYNSLELKHNLTNKPGVSFDINKIKIIVTNDAKDRKDAIPVSRDELNAPVGNFNKQSFETGRKDDMDCGKIIKITKPKSNIGLQNTNSDNTITCEIGKDIQNMVLQSDGDDSIPKTIKSNQIPEKEFQIQKANSKVDRYQMYANRGNNDGFPISNVDSFGIQKRNPEVNGNKIKDSDSEWNLFNNDITDDDIPTLSFYFDTEPNTNIKEEESPPTFYFENSKRNAAVKSANQPVKPKIKQNLSVDDKLKRFYVKNKIIDDRVKSRIEEWFCCYTQIMEDVLNEVLMKNPDYLENNLESPWILHQALQYVGIIYGVQRSVTTVVNKLSELLNCTCAKGKPKSNIKSNDYMKILGCGILLVQALKTVHPDYEGLTTAEESLDSLLEVIESQSDADVERELLKAPVVCRSDIRHDNEDRLNYVKDTSYIIDYLKKHYKVWESYEPTEDERTKPNCPDLKVVRTFGKNLNMLKIDNNKCMTLLKADADGTKMSKLSDAAVNEKDNVVQTAPTVQCNKNKIQLKRANIKESAKTRQTESKIDAEISPLSDYPTHGNTFATNAETAGPKVIRNMMVIEEYEKKLKEPLNFEVSDYESQFLSIHGSFNDDFNLSCDSNNATDVSLERIKKTDLEITDETANKEQANIVAIDNAVEKHFAQQKGGFKGDNIDNVDSADRNGFPSKDSEDSGFENDSTNAHSVVKMFFTELSESFNFVHGFVEQCVREIRGELTDSKKKVLHDKAGGTLEQMRLIIYKLRSIIQRESNEVSAVRNLMLKAGLEAATDKRITRYRQVVTKCMEQARILENALRMIVSITEGDYDTTSIKSESINSSIRYFNIFE